MMAAVRLAEQVVARVGWELGDDWLGDDDETSDWEAVAENDVVPVCE